MDHLQVYLHGNLQEDHLHQQSHLDEELTIFIGLIKTNPTFPDGNAEWLVKLNAVCMPLRYLWVFVAYIALKKAGEKFNAEYIL